MKYFRILQFSVVVFLMMGTTVAQAVLGTWQTDAAVGVNQLEMTVEVDCPAAGFICDQVDGYSDMQVSALSGSGSLEVDGGAGTIQFLTDGDVNLGFGLQPSYGFLSGSDLAFDYIPFAGVPEFVNFTTFATASPLISPSGFSSLAVGNYPVSAVVPYAALADVVGDLEFNVPDLIVPEQDVTLTGVFRVAGDTDLDGFVEYELDLSTSLLSVQAAQIAGEPVQISVTAQLTTHLSGVVPQALPVPLLGTIGILLLVAVLSGVAATSLRRI
jgi:hypothetical protein